LTVGTATGADRGQFLGRLDPFRRYLHPQFLPETHQRIENGGVAPPPPAIADKATVDLDAVEREQLQQSERGVGDPDIVEGNAYAEGTDEMKGRPTSCRPDRERASRSPQFRGVYRVAQSRPARRRLPPAGHVKAPSGRQLRPAGRSARIASSIPAFALVGDAVWETALPAPTRPRQAFVFVRFTPIQRPNLVL
jgi:hypothetical protein